MPRQYPSLRGRKPARHGHSKPQAVFDPRRYEWNVFESTQAFKTYFWILAALVIAVGSYHILSGRATEGVTFLFLVGSCLLPAYFWSHGMATGFPIFPLYCLTFAQTYGAQIVMREEITDIRNRFTASPDDLWGITVAVCLFALAGTLAWFLVNNKESPPPRECRLIDPATADKMMFAFFFASAVLTLLITMEWLGGLGRFLIIVRTLVRTAGMVAVFILSFRLGKKELKKGFVLPFFLLLAFYVSILAADLLLIGAISMVAIFLLGFTIGRKKVPWVSIAIILPLLFVLHSGKSDMRLKYWGERQQMQEVSLLEYPTFFFEWFQHGIENLNPPESPTGEIETPASIFERASLIQVFMTTYKLSPQIVPFLGGQTYASIPVLLIPRFIYPNKPIAHEGQRILNIHYGVQTAEMADETSIGWGMFNEAYANFGFLGCIGFGIVIGSFMGYVARKTSKTPLLSFPGLVGVLTLGFAIQTEMVSGVWCSAYFQSFAILVAIRFTLMQKELNPMAHTPPPSP
jgi:hypothetical protein